MQKKRAPKLDRKKRYVQIALNGTLSDAKRIISSLPQSERILLEAGTPFIKRYGISGIQDIRTWYWRHLQNQPIDGLGTKQKQPSFTETIALIKEQYRISKEGRATILSKNKEIHEKTESTLDLEPYIVADLKMMDRGDSEVQLAHEAGASAATALGHAPIESLNAFIEQCHELDIDSMIDMMNVEFPLSILRELKTQPDVVILHRGVDEERDNKQKMLPLYEIQRIKANYDTLIAVAGGDTLREVQSAIFNDADIVVLWKSFFKGGTDTGKLAQQFLDTIR